MGIHKNFTRPGLKKDTEKLHILLCSGVRVWRLHQNFEGVLPPGYVLTQCRGQTKFGLQNQPLETSRVIFLCVVSAV